MPGLPVGVASSHILKPDNARPQHYPYCPANEHFCMSLARAVGLPAPETALLHLPEPVYIVTRYDRLADGERVRRLHQIDLCQMLNKWPGYKYEAEGGATFRQAFESATAARQPAVAKGRLLRWLVFNYLVGNSDAHAKNISFLVRSEGLALAPFYDLLCVKVYGDDTMAMTIGEENRFGWVTQAAWDAVAEAIDVRKPFLRRIRVELAKALPEAAKALLARPEFTGEERQFLERVVGIVEKHAKYHGSIEVDRHLRRRSFMSVSTAEIARRGFAPLSSSNSATGRDGCRVCDVASVKGRIRATLCRWEVTTTSSPCLTRPR